MHRTALLALILLLNLSAFGFASGLACECHHPQQTPAETALSSKASFSAPPAQLPQARTLTLNLVPAPAPVPQTTYYVRKGDRLWTIAETVYGPGNGGEWHRIALANHVHHPSHIYPGDVLVIPPLGS
jgi:nucleoid-associated protein YgaU